MIQYCHTDILKCMVKISCISTDLFFKCIVTCFHTHFGAREHILDKAFVGVVAIVL